MEVHFDYRKFKELRIEMEITQFQLAELSGTSDRYIRAMEAGHKTNPSAILLFRAGLVLNQPVEAFMSFVMEDSENEDSE